MNGFFGIGFMELAFIAILALIVLGPERLPGAARETAKFLGQLRAMSSEFTSQFSEELQLLDELNPNKLADEIMKDAVNPPKKAAPAVKTKTAKKSAQPLAEENDSASGSDSTGETDADDENQILPPAAVADDAQTNGGDIAPAAETNDAGGEAASDASEADEPIVADDARVESSRADEADQDQAEKPA
mgnify:CR=1 FL=1